MTSSRTSRTARFAALPLAVALSLTGCTVVTAPGNGMPGMDHGSSQSPGAGDMADTMFVQMMIPHHEQAIEMSDILLAKDGIDADVAALAQQIKDAQTPEIELMESLLDEWGMPSAGNMGGMDHGDGMMSDDDIEELEEATGDEAQRLFLEQMIEHHEGAIDMAEDVIDDGSDPQVQQLAQTIVESQTAEIEQMEQMLAAM
jgi:uncharacterized protein (DUF305 family)